MKKIILDGKVISVRLENFNTLEDFIKHLDKVTRLNELSIKKALKEQGIHERNFTAGATRASKKDQKRSAEPSSKVDKRG